MRVDRFNSAICHIPFNGVESFFIWNKKKKIPSGEDEPSLFETSPYD